MTTARASGRGGGTGTNPSVGSNRNRRPIECVHDQPRAIADRLAGGAGEGRSVGAMGLRGHRRERRRRHVRVLGVPDGPGRRRETRIRRRGSGSYADGGGPGRRGPRTGDGDVGGRASSPTSGAGRTDRCGGGPDRIHEPGPRRPLPAVVRPGAAGVHRRVQRSRHGAVQRDAAGPVDAPNFRPYLRIRFGGRLFRDRAAAPDRLPRAALR